MVNGMIDFAGEPESWNTQELLIMAHEWDVRRDSPEKGARRLAIQAALRERDLTGYEDPDDYKEATGGRQEG